MLKRILAIDPGPEMSGFVIYDYEEMEPTEGVIPEKGHVANSELMQMITGPDKAFDAIAIEMVGHYGTGMAAGKMVFHTCLWIGRFMQLNLDHDALPFHFVFQPDTRLALCGQRNAKKANVRQAMVDLLGEKGTKANPGKTHGMSNHSWSALAVALTHAMGHSKKELEL